VFTLKVGDMKDQDLKKIRENLTQKSMAEIAGMVGCSYQTVSNVLRGKIGKTSTYTIPVLKEAAKIAKKNSEALQEVSKLANSLNYAS
jgi:transcriptional regulator with XRE-family HTH domain